MSRRSGRPRLAVTMGDPAGVGPEILAKAAAWKEVRQSVDLIAVGDLGTLRRAAAIVAPSLEFHAIDPDGVRSAELGAAIDESGDSIPVVDLQNVDAVSFVFGELRAEHGQAAYESLVAAIDLAMTRAVDAVGTPRSLPNAPGQLTTP